MNRIGSELLALVAAASLIGSPVLAASHPAHHTPSCKQIKSAIDSGKSPDAVAKELNTSSARVKSCTTPAVKHGKKGTTHPG